MSDTKSIGEIPQWVTSLFATCGVLVELDEHDMATGPVAGAMRAYVAADQSFTERVSRQVDPGPYVVVEHNRGIWTQSTSGKLGNKDLGRVYDALCEEIETGGAVKAVLQHELTEDQLSAFSNVSVVEHDQDRTVVVIVCEQTLAERPWPDVLGGRRPRQSSNVGSRW